MSNQLTDKELAVKLEQNLRRIMKEKNVTQRELASESGTDEANISRYLNRKQFPSGIMLIRIARALDATVEELIT